MLAGLCKVPITVMQSSVTLFEGHAILLHFVQLLLSVSVSVVQASTAIEFSMRVLGSTHTAARMHA